jgi:spore germination cell wall hydrolase CwlJ-like protein
MTDDELAALCIWEEAQGEPYEGKVAVGRVIRNRTAAHYASDGTVAGTVLHKWAFSGFWSHMDHGVYKQFAFDQAQAMAGAESELLIAKASEPWPDCQKAWSDAAAASGFAGGPQFQKLTPDTVLYCNPQISHPAWATPERFVCTVYRHSFYRDDTHPQTPAA